MLYKYEYNERIKPDIERDFLTEEIAYLKKKAVANPELKSQLEAKREELRNHKELKQLRLLADDATQEALISLIASNRGRMAVISSEGGIFEILNGRYTQSINIEIFLKAHCGDPYRLDRKVRPSEYIKEPCLTALLSVQPQVLEGLVTNTVFRGRGLTARCYALQDCYML